MTWLTIGALCLMAIGATMAYDDSEGYEHTYSYETDGYGGGAADHSDEGEIHTSYENTYDYGGYQAQGQGQGQGGYRGRRRGGRQGRFPRRRYGGGRRQRGGYGQQQQHQPQQGYGQQEQYQPQQQSYGGYEQQEDNQSYEDNTPSYGGGYGEQDSYGGYGEQQQSYAPRQTYGRRNRMNRHGKSGTFGYNNRYNKNKYVPVIIKKKKEKKRKIISSSTGFYIPGGTAVFGKFKDLHSCEKACELTPTCFAGDFNPWLGKCYLHSNISACQHMKAHKQITHFKKVPCDVVETPRGLITLGTAAYGGLEQKSIKSLMDCIKGCATAGGGVAALPSLIATTPQICFGIDYNFSQHKCYYHTDDELCGGDDDTLAIPVTPVRLVANPSSVNILICPVAPE